MSEIWKDVVNYEGQYEISSSGKIRSLNREINVVRGGTAFKLSRKGQDINYYKSINNAGYYFIALTCNKPKYAVHVLVAQAFLGPKPFPKAEVNHKDLNKANNDVSNLEYVTRSQNMLHASINGALRGVHKAKGALNPNALLTDADVLDIRTKQLTIKEYAAKYNIHYMTTYRISTRKTWTHI